jgi:hypothetical protein
MMADISTPEVREVFPGLKGYVRNVAVSADGSILYFTIRESESNIWLLDATGVR